MAKLGSLGTIFGPRQILPGVVENPDGSTSRYLGTVEGRQIPSEIEDKYDVIGTVSGREVGPRELAALTKHTGGPLGRSPLG